MNKQKLYDDLMKEREELNKKHVLLRNKYQFNPELNDAEYFKIVNAEDDELTEKFKKLFEELK